MELDTINKTLAELESNLRSLNSAREQVEQVTGTSLDVTNSANELIIEVKGLIRSLDTGHVENINKLVEVLEEFEKTAKLISSDFEKEIKSNLVVFGNNSSKVVKVAERNLNSTKAALLENINKLELELTGALQEFKENISVEGKNISESISELKQLTEKAINDIVLISVETLENQKLIIDNSLDSFSEVSKEQTRLLEILNNDLDTKFGYIENVLAIIKKRQNIYFIILILVILFGGGIVLIKLFL